MTGSSRDALEDRGHALSAADAHRLEPVASIAALELVEQRGNVGMSVPIGTPAAFTVVALLAGIAAAIMPARRASQRNALAALRYD